MKNKISLFMLKFGGLIASVAYVVTVMNVNSACGFIDHQPKLPASASKLSKI